MTLIEALLLLPDGGEPTWVDWDAAVALAERSASFARPHGRQWRLTDGGRRFLGQFRTDDPDSIRRIVVRLVVEDGTPVFHLFCGAGRVMRVERTRLKACLRLLQAAYPGVKLVFDYRPSGHVS